MIWARSANPPARRRRGGRPVRSNTGCQRVSRAISAAMPASRSASVLMWVTITVTVDQIGSFLMERGSSPRVTSMQPVFRFAPSPNGYLHLGHALSVLIDFEMARRVGGRFLLRIEDIDAARCRPEFEQAIYEDLAWLGITWEEPVRRQSAQFEAYRSSIGKLEAQALVYPSFESRADIARLVSEREARGHWPRDPDGAPLYPGTAKKLSADERANRIASGEAFALRLDMH